ncbi:hypothetical protein [Pseudomonas sp. Tri1]|uniref:hypothetical protein n=1 Tax=Pseudomonas sp. Tri1 TaxID=2823875 RepID=UPI001B32E5A8|nr:hypothetical protein [Pseudomonas sp. Tri1]
MRAARSIPFASAILIYSLCQQAQAYKLYDEDDGATFLNAELMGAVGFFTLNRNYLGDPDRNPSRMNWQEGIIKYGFSGATDKIPAGSVYGGFSLLSTGSFGDGDPGGVTAGNEHATTVEEAYIGWRSGEMFPALGQDGVDLSIGRQLAATDSFMVVEDGFSPGNAFNPDPNLPYGSFDRGGAYTLGMRLAFANTVVLRLGGDEGLHGDLMWIKSNNRIEGEAEFAVTNIDYTTDFGTIGTTYIQGLDVNKKWVQGVTAERDSLKAYSIRGESRLGIENADFAFEVALQNNKGRTENGMYFDVGYTFADAFWKPLLSFRQSRFSKDWDPIFPGGYRKRFPGEVGAGYAGPTTNNYKTNDVFLSLHPTDDLSLNAQYFVFTQLSDRDKGDMGGKELDLSVDWMATENIVVSPLIGFFKPNRWLGNGGLQSGDDSIATLMQLTVWFTY